MLIINCYKITVFLLFTTVFLPVGFLFYKYLLHYDQNGSCPVTAGTMLYLYIIHSYGSSI